MFFNNLLKMLKKMLVYITERVKIWRSIILHLLLLLLDFFITLISFLWDAIRVLIIVIPDFSNVTSMYYIKNPNKFWQRNYAYWKTVYLNFKQSIFYLIHDEFEVNGYPNRYNIWHIKMFYKFLCKLWFFIGGKYSWVFNKGFNKWTLYYKKNIDELNYLIESCNPYDGSSLFELYDRFIRSKTFIRSLPCTLTMLWFDWYYVIPFIFKIILGIIKVAGLVAVYIFFYLGTAAYLEFSYFFDLSHYEMCVEMSYKYTHPWIYKHPYDFTVWCYEPAYNNTSLFRDVVVASTGNELALAIHPNLSQSFMFMTDQVIPLCEFWWNGRLSFYNLITCFYHGYSVENVNLQLLDFYRFVNDRGYCVFDNLTLKELFWRDIINSYTLTINNLDTSILVIKPSYIELYVETDYIKILLNNHSTSNKYNFGYLNYKLSYKTKMDAFEYVFMRWVHDGGYRYIDLSKFSTWHRK